MDAKSSLLLLKPKEKFALQQAEQARLRGALLVCDNCGQAACMCAQMEQDLRARRRGMQNIMVRTPKRLHPPTDDDDGKTRDDMVGRTEQEIEASCATHLAAQLAQIETANCADFCRHCGLPRTKHSHRHVFESCTSVDELKRRIEPTTSHKGTVCWHQLNTSTGGTALFCGRTAEQHQSLPHVFRHFDQYQLWKTQTANEAHTRARYAALLAAGP